MATPAAVNPSGKSELRLLLERGRTHLSEVVDVFFDGCRRWLCRQAAEAWLRRRSPFPHRPDALNTAIVTFSRLISIPEW